MDIVFSANNREQVMVLPVVPPDISIEVPQDNEDFDSIKGAIKLIGNMGLTKLSISSFFPVHNYKWLATGSTSDGWAYVKFFEKYRKEKLPFRCVITTKDGATRLNIACVVNSFSYSVDSVGDINYSLDIEEYRFTNL